MKPLSVDEALSRILGDVMPVTNTERRDLAAAAGDVLAAPLAAKLTQPPFNSSAMDGYAVRGADVANPPVTLQVVGEAAAGHPFNGEVNAGTAVRIFTGAPVPAGADAIVIQENTSARDSNVEVREGTPDEAHIRKRGCDFAEGDLLVQDNRRLTPRDITLAAAMGHAELEVRRPPNVAIIATGDELVRPGVTPQPGQIVSSNPYGLAALLKSAGAAPDLRGIAIDELDELKRMIDECAEADIIVTIGGASVGDHDLVIPALKSCGYDIDFWKIAMRPGKPLLFGKRGTQRVIGLPGNPVSSLICTRVFIVPLILKMLNTTDQSDWNLTSAQLTQPLGPNGPRQHYMRALTQRLETGTTTVTPAASQDSSLLKPLAGADVLIVRPPNDPALPEGAVVTVIPIDF